MDEADEDFQSNAEFETWHVYDAGGSPERLKGRYRGDAEVPDSRDGPDVFDALRHAAANARVGGFHQAAARLERIAQDVEARARYLDQVTARAHLDERRERLIEQHEAAVRELGARRRAR